MAKVLVVTSGKGGVGKTTSTAAIGAALAQRGEKVVVVDFDVGLRNLDLIMGAERRVVFDLINVAQGVAKLSQALIRDKRLESLWLLPASQTRDKDALTEEGVRDIIADLRTKFDWVICDSPAGIERGATLAMRYADEAIVVTNPEVSSVRDADRIIGMLDSKTVKAEAGEQVKKHVLITRYDTGRAARGEMLSIDDILEILAIRLCSGLFRCGIPGDSAAGDHSRKPGRAACLERRLAGHAERCREHAGAGLFRRGAPPHRRDGRHDGTDRAAPRLHGSPAGTEGCMSINLLQFLRRRTGSAPVARERLQILLAHERGLRSQPDLLGILREEILAVVSRHIELDPDKVVVRMDRGSSVSTLEVDIEIPNGVDKRLAAAS